MPVLHYDPEVSNLPDISKQQECDTCHVVGDGSRMFYSFPRIVTDNPVIRISCGKCMLIEKFNKGKKTTHGSRE